MAGASLLTLLDDIATLLDDVALMTKKATAKTAGVLGDDLALNANQLTGLRAERELPVIWTVAKGSARNKLILVPAALAISALAPWAVLPLLMLGGLYLCFEGVEKLAHRWLHPPAERSAEHRAMLEAAARSAEDLLAFERDKIRGAIRTDFILSAEIMTIALSAIPPSNIWMEGATLAVVAVGITVVVYGAVALIVKADDMGLFMAKNGILRATRALGRAIVRLMPRFMWLLTVVGTAAMLWVGGSIIIHGLDTLGWPVVYDWIHHVAEEIGHTAGKAEGAVTWGIVAALDGAFGLALGLVLVPIGTRLIAPVWQRIAKLNPFV